MKKFIVALMMGLALIVPASAQEVCHTKDEIRAQVLDVANDSTILYETEEAIRFTSPTRPFDMILLFKKDCLAEALLVEKGTDVES